MLKAETIPLFLIQTFRRLGNAPAGTPSRFRPMPSEEDASGSSNFCGR